MADPAGRILSFQYSASNDLVATTDPAGGTTQFAYDGGHRVTSIILPTGNTLLQNTYDVLGRVVSQTNGRNATTTFAYDVPNIGDRTITDARGNQTIHTYDGSLRIVKVKDALLGTTSFTYDANNDRTNVTNAAGKTTNFAYDSRGNLTGITDPLGGTIGFTYDSRNNLLTARNAKGNNTTFSYDGNSNLIGILDALGGQTTFNYDGFGELTSKTNARGNTTSFTYGGSGNLTRITDALGNATALAYDSISRLTSITDPNGHAASAFYDALSRLVKISDPLGNQTKFTYDAAGNLTQITDAKGNATAYAYDAVNNLVKVTDALGRTTQYGYDGNNNRVTFTNAKSKTTSYGHDAINRLFAVTDPLGFASSYTYDPVGNVTAITDANGRTNQFAYDALNRLIGISYADGKMVSYAYDANGNRTSMTDSHGTTAYSYDALDRLASVVHPGSKTVAYGYDATGNRVSLTCPDSKLTTYTYDPLNRLSRATDWAARSTNYTYDQASNLKQILYSTGARLNFGYDAANRLLQVVNAYQGSQGDPISSFTYLLDAVGNRLKVTDGSGKATSYGYDALNELKSVTVGTSVTNFTYDVVGNRLTLTAPSTSINYSYDAADRLLAAGGTTFAYDKNGNQITKTPPNSKPLTFTYDAANRLISILGGKANSSVAYDGDGNRISQTVGSGAYNYINDVATALPVALQESGPDGNISYAYGLGLISESGSGFDYFYHYDGLGSVVGLTDPGTKLAGRYSYDAWGQTDTSIPDTQIGTKNKFRFTGEVLDPGTQLYYLRARYYDPTIAGERRPVEGNFVLRATKEVGFQIASYDQSQPLVIDPTISYATFLGGAGDDKGGINVDTTTPSAPKLYVPGITTDITTFPETSTKLGASPGGSHYIFVAKVDPALTGAASLDYLTFIGGNMNFTGSAGCDVDGSSAGLDTSLGASNVEIVLGGTTNCENYPVTTGSHTSGPNDIFITRLHTAGNSLDVSIFFGGNGQELIGGGSLDSSGNMYVGSYTTSTDLPVTAGAYSTKLNNGSAGFEDCFVAKLSRSFVVEYLTYLNVGAGTTSGQASALGCFAAPDPSGRIAVEGTTFSSTALSAPNGFQTTFKGLLDLFLVELDPTLSGTSQRTYASYFGGGGGTFPGGGAFVKPGVIALAGETESGTTSNPGNIPLTANAYQSTNQADPASTKGTGYVTIVDLSKTGAASLIFSSYFGGTGGDERIQALAYDAVPGNTASYRLVFGGQTTSTTLPLKNAMQSTLTGGQNGWLAVLDVPSSGSAAAALLFSSYIGGNYTALGSQGTNEQVEGIGTDSAHTIYAAARTLSDNFFAETTPATTVNGFQTKCGSCSRRMPALWMTLRSLHYQIPPKQR